MNKIEQVVKVTLGVLHGMSVIDANKIDEKQLIEDVNKSLDAIDRFEAS
jgi:hypothetical protein